MDVPSEADIIQRESGGKPFIGWSGVDLSGAPLNQYGFPIWKGAPGPAGISHAAGLYQFEPHEWAAYAGPLGIKDFSPESQKKVYEAARANEGARPWAASAPVQKEGEYGGALHVNVQPEHQRDPNAFLDYIMAAAGTAGATPETGAGTAPDPMAMLDKLLGSSQSAETPQADKPAPQPAQAAPAPSNAPAPPNLLAQAAPLAAQPLQTVGNVATSGPHPTAPAPPVAPTRPQPAPGTAAPQPQAGAPQPAVTPPAALLDRLLGAPAAAGARAVGAGMTSAAPAASEATPEERAKYGEQAEFVHSQTAPPQNLGGELLEQAISPVEQAGQPLEPGATRLGEVGNMVLPYIVGGAPRGTLSAGAKVPSVEPGIGKRVADGVQAVVSPTTIDKSSLTAEAISREETGLARQEAAQAEAQFTNAERRLVSHKIPEYGKWLAGDRNPATPPELQRFVDYIEGIGKADFDPALKPVAQKIKALMQHYRMEIEADPKLEGANFVEDYFQHMWQEKSKARVMFGQGAKTGSGRSLKQRSIPTLSEGIQAGLTPVHLDPIANTLAYVNNMAKYLSHNRIFRGGEEAGYIEFHEPGAQPEGYAELNGRLATKGSQKAYAPAPFARVYNHSIAPSLASRQDEWGNIYRALLHGKNAITTAVLGLPFFHAAAMSIESMASGLATGVNAAGRGQIGDAAKLVGMSLMPGLKQSRDIFTAGRRLERQYLGIADYGTDYEKIADLLARSGGRGASRGTEWKFSGATNYITALKRGQLKLSLAEPFRGKSAGGKALEAAKTIPRELARTMETVMSPLFEHAIPRMKNAAFYDEMRSWLQANPEATEAEQVTRARQVWDSIDDRFGEVVMDNLFWSRGLKDTLNILAVSQGWELGTLRSFGGSALDLAAGGPRRVAGDVAGRGGRWSPRTSYMVGLVSATALVSTMYEYLKTGHLPESASELMGQPATGGTTPEGAPEHAWLPGYIPKEPMQFAHSPFGYFLNKLSPFVEFGKEVATGKDYQGRDIAPEPTGTPQWFKDWGSFVLQSFTPIPARQQQLEGSNIGGAERWGGVRPAPDWADNPARAAGQGEVHDLMQRAQKAASDYTQARRQGKDSATIRDLLIKRGEAYRALRLKERMMRGQFKVQPPSAVAPPP